MPSLIRKVRFTAILALLASVPVAAQTPPDDDMIRADDRARLAALDEAAGLAMRGAFAAGDSGDLTVLASALAGEALDADTARELMPGEWSCRMMKLGGGLPIVVYQPFRCRADAGGGFEKLTGSQRSKGKVVIESGQLVYLGTGFVAGETPPDYRALPDEVDPGATPQFMPEIGLVEIVAANKGRIVFPRPHLESVLNILVLSR